MSLSETLYPLLSTGSTQKDRPDMTKNCQLGRKESNQAMCSLMAEIFCNFNGK